MYAIKIQLYSLMQLLLVQKCNLISVHMNCAMEGWQTLILKIAYPKHMRRQLQSEWENFKPDVE